MPKLKTTNVEEKNAFSRGVLADYLARVRKAEKDFGSLIGVSQRVGQMRLESPDNLKISEIRRIEKYLTDEQIVRLVRGRAAEKQCVNVYISSDTLKKVVQSL